MAKVSVIIAAAGNAERMQGINKQFAFICGIPVLVRSMLAFEHIEDVCEIIVAAKQEDHDRIKEMAQDYGVTKLKDCAAGGSTRQESVINALRLTGRESRLIAVHDGARPLVREEDIRRCIHDAEVFGGAVLGVPVKDTIKEASGGLVEDTPDRRKLYITQTPQIFVKDRYFEGVNFAVEHGLDFTDDCQLAEAVGVKVCMTPSSYSNIKITTPEDLAVAAALLGSSSGREVNTMIRVGQGYDVHKLSPERKLILGGCRLNHNFGLVGHSDADVLVHAVMDALLGACALGDIGQYFPDSDPKWKDADSLKMLREVVRIIGEKGYVVSNIDSTLVLQVPKIAPFIFSMRRNIAEACGIDVSQVSVKATTEEKLGFTGRCEGIAAHAVCLVEGK
ncbi:MAG: 2-C-methyl-D-erythritol 2,4-cyclodiphosphate synthase [Oscillospiraceae bacterium]|nr:2-C-methyl-D-erythritol 2,4-cyclodiphosphate synthase [Oscillospiraceae bacterium]